MTPGGNNIDFFRENQLTKFRGLNSIKADGAPVIFTICHQKKIPPNFFLEASCFHLPTEWTLLMSASLVGSKN